jgi:hypothetical protein
MQHAKRMRRVVLSSEASPALHHFSSSQNGTKLGTQFLNKKRLFCFSLQLISKKNSHSKKK